MNNENLELAMFIRELSQRIDKRRTAYRRAVLHEVLEAIEDMEQAFTETRSVSKADIKKWLTYELGLDK